jgi:hypothetical protein
MIEKLKNIPIDMNGEPSAVWLKINELVDTVNILQAQVAILEEHAHPTATTEPVDPYAKQRKWAGKLCWFWDAEPEDKIVDVLSCIDISDKYPYVMCDHQVHYKHCEPVKPTDDIIYKGDDNE